MKPLLFIRGQRTKTFATQFGVHVRIPFFKLLILELEGDQLFFCKPSFSMDF